MLQPQKLFHRIIKDHRIEQFPAEMLPLPRFVVGVLATVTKETELFQRNTRHFLKYVVWHNRIKSLQRRLVISIGHQERRNRP